MKLVAGLGNPGRRYEGTRHNVGFLTIAALARKFATSGVKERFQGEVAEADLEGQKVLLLAPSTYMNASGGSVLAARDFYKILNEDLLVVCDDLNLPLGRLRVRAGGSSGGQKGVEDIIRRLGTDDFARLRIGIGSPPQGRDWANYVLNKFSKEEMPEIEQAVARAAEAVVVWAREGIAACMNRYNAKTLTQETEE
jgi:peptidyl-tRNA hydrolase, PTH1 family